MRQHFTDKQVVIGMMSGTSLDGMDLVAVKFGKNGTAWKFNILAAETTSYSDQMQAQLSGAQLYSGEQLIDFHHMYGKWIGEQILRFAGINGIRPGLIASHGHTIFHQPSKGFTFQAGSGANIAAVTGIPVVADFRPGDVALGGQGAPLVPVGDRLLFGEYAYCLNLGGFANISYEVKGSRVAFDICPVNFVLNQLARQMGYPYDKDGKLGKDGQTDPNLLDNLNTLSYFKEPPPKSLGREWVELHVFPLLERSNQAQINILRTFYEHIAIQISCVTGDSRGKMLVTGGGAFNTFLMERIAASVNARIVIPPADIVNYREALIFAFLGLLHVLEINNCYASVTGAHRDHRTGVLFLP